MTWNPVAAREPVTIPLECSGGEASATFRPWSGRERLAYEDAMTVRLLALDGEGAETVRFGTMRLVGLTLTLERLHGFPEGWETPTEEQLLSLEPEVLAELTKHALDVQPLPRGGDDEDKPADADGEGDEGPVEGSADVDPSQTPPTRAAARTKATDRSQAPA